MKQKVRILFLVVVLLASFIGIKVYGDVNKNLNFDEINSRIEKGVKDYHIPSLNIVILDRDKILFSKGYGQNQNLDRPYLIGSMSKSFTALGIMQLVEEGKISLDSPISVYLDASKYLRYPKEGEGITVRELLNHTSGLDTYSKFKDAHITENKGIYEYANVNYGLLGKIIESVSGKSYEDYVNDNIFLPLKMTNSAASYEKSLENHLISGYRNYFGVPVPGEPDYPKEGSWTNVPAGYISSSANDMAKYLSMYLNGGKGIISKESIQRMFNENVPITGLEKSFYGMGFVTENDGKEPIINHFGLVEDFTSAMYILPNRGIAIVALVNMNDYLVGNQLLDGLISPIFKEDSRRGSFNPYVLNHCIIDIICLMILVLTLYPFLTMTKWKSRIEKKSMDRKRIGMRDWIFHLLIPLAILSLPLIIKTPYWVIYYFVKDVFFVLLISAKLLFLLGIYKIRYLHSIKVRIAIVIVLIENDV